jgi:hypothetical protein
MSIDKETLQELERQAKNMIARKDKAVELMKTHQHDGIYFAIVNLNLASEIVKIKGRIFKEGKFPSRIC